MDLENLVDLGCNWLQDYLPNHPETLAELQLCQNKSILMAAAPTLVAQGEELARTGEFEKAVAKFKQAKEWNPQLDINPETKAKVTFLLFQGKELASKGDIKKAISAYAEAEKLDPKLEISADDWNSLCWDGSLHGYAADVMFACEKAVTLAPTDGGIRDSRGLARALTGDTKGAIEDFQAFIQSSDDSKQKSQRQGWVNALNAGKNPFTESELEKLRQQ
ncbi:MAG: tetratricopeptide repeat protein [Aulosira sp. DedQUE10]|nr:tetratricopeptide repeat protein [Aulosira sp. DedQUE10]